MDVKIGIQNVTRELVIETDESTEDIEKAVTTALETGSVLTLSDTKGRRTVVPSDKIGFVEIGSSTIGQVGFRS